MAKEFFKVRKIKFEEVDAAQPKNAQEMIKISGQMGVPVIDIDGKIIVGFDISQITEALKKKK
jgi:glutaredoxin